MIEIKGKGGITAKVIADSISKEGVRITTLQLTYPRFVHAEFMTHRVFSRNASSSRAIPVAKMIEQVRTNPAMPIHWGKNQPGMQANEELTGFDLTVAKSLWLDAANAAANYAEEMMERGAHKQVVNRILEPFQFIHVVVTATEWQNFFDLRAHPDAQPEIHELAICIQEAMAQSSAKLLLIGDWHLPYISDEERAEHELLTLIKASAARCARVSYLKHDGTNPEIKNDLELYERLVGSAPIHASPVEHQATPLAIRDSWSGNFRGWFQYRKVVEANIEGK